MCGTPVVAFNTGGAEDLIETMKTGYLASLKDSADLARGIYTMLTIDLSSIRVAARQITLQEHSPSVVAKRYLELYNSLLNDQ